MISLTDSLNQIDRRQLLHPPVAKCCSINRMRVILPILLLAAGMLAVTDGADQGRRRKVKKIVGPASTATGESASSEPTAAGETADIAIAKTEEETEEGAGNKTKDDNQKAPRG